MLLKFIDFLGPNERKPFRPTLKQVMIVQILLLVLVAGLGVWHHYPRYDWRRVQERDTLKYHVQQMNNECLVDGQIDSKRFKEFVLDYPNNKRVYIFQKTQFYKEEVPFALALFACIHPDQMSPEDSSKLWRWILEHGEEFGYSAPR